MNPQKIKFLISGKMMNQIQLYPMIRKYSKEFLNEYIQKKEVLYNIYIYVIPNGLGNDEIIIGVFVLVIEADKEKLNIINNYYIVYIKLI